MFKIILLLLLFPISANAVNISVEELQELQEQRLGFVSQSNWNSVLSAYLQPTTQLGVLLNGVDLYLSFGSVYGSSGYGVRDNSGTMQFSNDGGSWADFGSGGGSGTVTSVGMTVPTGLEVANSPITTSGTLAVIYLAGYEGLRTASSTNWNAFFDTPSTVITDGNGLTWSSNTLNFDGGDTPSGELGNTWASPTVNSTHSGSAHHTIATVTDTDTINMTLTGQDIQADSLLTFDDGLTLATASVDCDTASGSVFGCLSSANWTTFNNKQNAITDGTNLTFAGDTLNVDDPFSVTNLTATNLTSTYASTTLLTVTDDAWFTNGNVGIGVDPSWLLHVNSGASPANNQFQIQANGVGGLSFFSYRVDDSHILFDAEWASNGNLSLDAGSSFAIRKTTDKLILAYDTAAVGAAVSWNSGLILDVAGNVGIGTTTPLSLLTVNGDINIENQNSLKLYNPRGSTDYYTAMAATSTQAVDIQLYLPVVQGGADQVLFNDGSGNLRWDEPPVGAVENLYLTNYISDITGYSTAVATATSTSEVATTTPSITGASYLIEEWVSGLGQPDVTSIPDGIWGIHVHALKTNTKSTRLQATFYKRATGGAEVALGTTELSSLLTTDKAEYDFHLATTTIGILATDRIVMKLSAIVSGGGSDPTVTVYSLGGNFSHFAFPAEAASVANFVPYSGAIQDVALGVYDLTATKLTSTYASSTQMTVSGDTWLTDLAVAAGTFLAVDGAGLVIATSTPSGGGADQTPWAQNIDAATYTLTDTGAIGVASSTPWGLLSVNPDALSGVPQFVVGSSTATNFIVADNGNIGIRTTNPQELLHIVADSGSTGVIRLEENSGGEYIYMTIDSTGGWNLKNDSDVVVLAYSDDSNNIAIQSGTEAAPGLRFTIDPDTGMYRIGADILGFSTDGTNRFTIGATGNIGIGTTTPQDLLVVEGVMSQREVTTGTSTASEHYGQIYVSGHDSLLYFVSDAGTQYDLTAGVGAGDVSKVGTPANSQVGVWTGDGTIEGDASLTYDQSNLLFTGDLGADGTEITKGWLTDLDVTNAIAGSVTGNAGTVSTITTLAPDTATTQATQPSITTMANLVEVGALGAGSLAAGFTDVPVLQGGTGVSSFTANSLLYSNSAGTALAYAATSTMDIGGEAGTVVGFTPASGSLTLAGADALTITTTGTTNSTLPLGTKTLVATDVATLSSLTSVGALAVGSITSGFTSIDLGAGTFDTSGQVTGGLFVADSTTATSTFAGGFTVQGTALVVQDDSGNVGIGTTTPAELLDVDGDFRVGIQGANANLLFVDTANGRSVFQVALEIPNGASPTVNSVGEIALDTTSNFLLIATSTTPVVVRTTEEIFAFTLASTSPEFFNGGSLPVPPEIDAYTVTSYSCYATAGTSVVLTPTDGSNAMDAITCTTSLTTDTAISQNSSVTAGELMSMSIGAVTGSVDYVSFSAFGTWERD